MSPRSLDAGTGPLVPVSREMFEHYHTDPHEIAARDAINARMRADLLSAVMADGTIRTERQPVTVNDMLADPFRIARKLRAIVDNLEVSAGLLPRDINERIADRAADLRAGRSRRRYRGAHRSGAHTVADLERYVEAQLDDDRATHRRSLRRPVPTGPVHIGDRKVQLRFYGGVPAEAPFADATATLTMVADEPVLTVPIIAGPPGPAADDFDTAPIPLPVGPPYHRGIADGEPFRWFDVDPAVVVKPGLAGAPWTYSFRELFEPETPRYSLADMAAMIDADPLSVHCRTWLRGDGRHRRYGDPDIVDPDGTGDTGRHHRGEGRHHAATVPI